MASQAKRYQIVALKNAGIADNDITKQLNVSRKTVYNMRKVVQPLTKKSTKYLKR